MSPKKYKLLYFVSEDEYFISHKIEQVKEALKKNIDVLVVTKFKKKEKQILDAGFKTMHIDFDRKSITPIKEFLCILKLVTIIFKFKPNIIQANALKPILYISLISHFLTKKTKVILCVVGLGYLFIKKNKIIIFDGSHNLSGAEKLNIYLKENNIQPNVIFGMLNNKKAFEFLSIIKKNIDILYPIQIPDEKNAYTQEEIYKVSKKIKLKTVIVTNLSTINKLLINSSNKYILVTGSLYLIGKIRKKYL